MVVMVDEMARLQMVPAAQGSESSALASGGDNAEVGMGGTQRCKGAQGSRRSHGEAWMLSKAGPVPRTSLLISAPGEPGKPLTPSPLVPDARVPGVFPPGTPCRSSGLCIVQREVAEMSRNCGGGDVGESPLPGLPPGTDGKGSLSQHFGSKGRHFSSVEPRFSVYTRRFRAVVLHIRWFGGRKLAFIRCWSPCRRPLPL